MASRDESIAANAERQRRHREKAKRNAGVTDSNASVTLRNATVTDDLHIADTDADTDTDLSLAKKKKAAPESLPLPFYSDEFKSAWMDWVDFRKSKKKPISVRSQKMIFADFVKWGESAAIEAIGNSIRCDWSGIFEPSQKNQRKTGGNHAGIQENIPF